MLVDSSIANEFLGRYIAVLAEVNGGAAPQGTEEFIQCRELLYSDSESIPEYTSVSEDFKDALSRSIHGQFIFLRKYKNWYAFQHMETNQYFAALGLTSPIETLVEDFCIVETALVPFGGVIVCDGLIINKNMLLGKNMMKNCRDGYFQAKNSGALIREL